ncbi:MAG: hypothetical protein K0V04_29275 [Deltaproteobacteria bacterium]|nr:hypothetical protein [Deltaproteobacteria bacterium]
MSRVLWMAVCSSMVACTPWAESVPETQRLDEAQVAPAPTPEPAAEDQTPDEGEPADVRDHAPAPTGTGSCSATPAAPVEPLHPDLALDLQYEGTATVQPGQWIPIKGHLRNGSGSETHHAVLPNDGSEVAWREPHTWYSGFVDTGNGCWQPLDTHEIGRCGMFAETWTDDVIALAPGETVPIEWMGNPASSLGIQREGRVRLFMHYAYREGTTGKSGSTSSGPVGAMAGTRGFELVSNPIEFDVIRPLELSLSAKPHRGLGNISRISDVVDVTLTNVGDRSRMVVPPRSGRLRFEIEGTEPTWAHADWNERHDAMTAKPLKAGASVSLLGEHGLIPDLLYAWTPAKAETVKIRALYRPYDDTMTAEFISAWVEVDLR